MPENEKILFGSIFMSFFSKIYNLRYFLIDSGARKSRFFRGEKFRFPNGGGGINIHFRPKYRPLSLLLLFFDQGSGIGKNQDPGFGINILDPQHYLDVYPGSKFFPSRIRIKAFKYLNSKK
jgi:hypothetical protein